MKVEQAIAKALNHSITQKKFVDRDLDNYIYASLSQPPIKIIDKCNSKDEMDYIVECPNCGSHIKYGTSTFMLSGHIYCDTNGCREKLNIPCNFICSTNGMAKEDLEHLDFNFKEIENKLNELIEEIEKLKESK